ncbi:MAG: hypothetical protein AB1324_06710 [Candidatus Micrarchaeota archaeon]
MKFRKLAAGCVLAAGVISGCGSSQVRDFSWREQPYVEVDMTGIRDRCPTLPASLQLYRGQEIGFGLTPKVTHMMAFSDADTNDAVADAVLPIPSGREGSMRVSVLVRFNGVPLDIPELTVFADSMCRAVESSRNDFDERRERPVENGADTGPTAAAALDALSAAPPDEPARRRELPFPPEDVASALSRGLGAAVHSLFSMQRSGGGRGDASLSLVSSDRNIFTLRVQGGDFSGESVRLSRRVEVVAESETRGEPAALSIPYRIVTLTAQNGTVSASVEIDCSREVQSYSSEGAIQSFQHPSCRLASGK